MKKILLTIGLLVSSLILVSCVSYYARIIYKQNVRWTSQDDLLQFEIQGLDNEAYGFGTLKVNHENVDVMVILTMGPYELSVFSENNQNALVRFEVKVNKATSLTLTCIENNSDDETYNNIEIIINRIDLKEDELDAKKYLETSFINEELNISLDYDMWARFTYKAVGDVLINDNLVEISLEFLEAGQFEITTLMDNKVVMSGSYITGLASLELQIDFNDDFLPIENNLILDIEYLDIR